MHYKYGIILESRQYSRDINITINNTDREYYNLQYRLYNWETIIIIECITQNMRRSRAECTGIIIVLIVYFGIQEQIHKDMILYY